MKIATIAYLQGFGGAEKQLIMLSNALASMGHYVTMVMVADNKVCYDIDEGVRIIDITYAEKIKGIQIVNRYIALKRVLKEIRPDVTIHFNYQSVYLCALMNKRFVGRIIYSERGDPSDSEYSGLLYYLRKYTLFRVDGFVFQSKGAQEFFNKNIQDKSIIIHNPIFLKKTFNDQITKDNVIVNVGRLHPQKNQELLIRAFQIVHNSYPSIKLHIYGEGELKNHLVSLISSLQLTDSVCIIPPCTNIDRIILRSILFVLSSDFEGMPNVLLEAMSLGVPCISTDYRPGGVAEIIKDDVNGFIVPAGNVLELSSRIVELLSDEKKQELFSQESKKILHNHMPEVIYNKWNIYINTIYNNN